MKQVEMALQFLRTKRSNSCHAAPDNDEEMQALLYARSDDGCESLAITVLTWATVLILSLKTYKNERRSDHLLGYHGKG